MNRKSKKNTKGVALSFFSIVFGLTALQINAQALYVFGGDSKAEACFENARIASKISPGNRSMLEPCDYALDYSSLNLKDRAATFSNKGIILMSLGKYPESLMNHEKAVTLQPERPEIYVNRGNSYFFNRDYIMALDDYETARGLNVPQLHFVHFNMGLVLERMGKNQQAEAEYLEALEIEPGWDIAVNRLAFLREKMAEKKLTNENEE